MNHSTCFFLYNKTLVNCMCFCMMNIKLNIVYMSKYLSSRLEKFEDSTLTVNLFVGVKVIS